MEIEPAMSFPVLITMVQSNGTRLNRYRATLVSGDKSIWRCDCNPHKNYELARKCGNKALLSRQRHSQQQTNDTDARIAISLSKSGVKK